MVSNARLGCCFISYVASVCAINTLAGSAGVQRAADGVLFFMFMYIILIVEGPDGFVLAVPQGWDIGLQGIAVKGNGKVVSSNPRYEVVKEERSTGNCVVVGRAKGRPGIEDSGFSHWSNRTDIYNPAFNMENMDAPFFPSSAPLFQGLESP